VGHGGVGAMIAERIRDAHATGRPLRIRGAGTWLHAGRPTHATESLSLADHRGIVEYVPGDLTLTARAGTPLSEIVAATKAENQWLPLDPWGGDDGTLGATVSTATAGPHSHAMGLPRDVVLGLEVVNGKGEIIRAGGRVVKNVAGFDLTRLMMGSWGTLGAITEVSVRLRARPDHTRTLAVAVQTSARALNELAIRLRALPFTPMASEVVNEALAAHLGIGNETTLVVRIGGNEKSLRGQLELLRQFGDLRDAPADVWKRLRVSDPPSASSWRFSQLPSLFGETWNHADGESRSFGAFVHGSPARGVARVSVARDTPSMEAGPPFSGTIAIESLAPALQWMWGVAEAAGVAGAVGANAASERHSVSPAIRRKFDPKGIMNPGILERLG